jgi:hypothetical protein
VRWREICSYLTGDDEKIYWGPCFQLKPQRQGAGLGIAKSSPLSSFLGLPKMSLAKMAFRACDKWCNALLCTELPIPLAAHYCMRKTHGFLPQSKYFSRKPTLVVPLAPCAINCDKHKPRSFSCRHPFCRCLCRLATRN